MRVSLEKVTLAPSGLFPACFAVIAIRNTLALSNRIETAKETARSWANNELSRKAYIPAPLHREAIQAWGSVKGGLDASETLHIITTLRK